MKNKISSFFLITILLLGGGLAAIGLTSCENFMNGGDTRKEIEDAIAYNNAQECTVVFRADAGTGEFLGSVERTYKVGYESEVQFELNTEDYVFKTLEAVCQTDRSVSRASSVEFKEISRNDKKGIYKYTVKLLSDTKDVLIRPVCLAVPKITSITPAFESNGCDQDTIIKINFNKPMKPDSFEASAISIYSDDNLSEYFEAAKFSSDNKTLYITPKENKLILPPDGAKSVLNIEVNYDFTSLKDSDGLTLSEKGTHTYKINKNFGNEKKVKVLLQSDSVYGSFLSAGEKECILGYTIDLQFNLKKSDYKFINFEAVSSGTGSESRSDCVAIENTDYNDETGIYKAKLRVITEQNDILIRPKCLAYPAVISHTPDLATEAQTTDKAIKIQFNKSVLETQNTSLSSALFTYSNISIICQNDNSNMSNEYFEAPVFDEQKMLLTLTPKAKKLKTFIDNLHLGSVDLSVSLSSAISVIKDETILSLKQDDNSSFTVRYKADTEKTKPSTTDFLVTRNKIQLDNVKNLTADKKFKLDSIDITAAEIPAADIQKNRASNGAVYIYGSYFDEDSGVKDVVISKRMLQNNGELSTAAETTFNPESNSQIAQFVSDGQGNTSFVIKYDFATLGKAYVIDVVVRDNCDNSSLAKTVSVFVPKYGDALGENFYYLKNAPDYQNEDLTVEQYSAELKNLKIYPTSFTAYSDVKIPVEDLTIYCEYKDKTGADKKQQFNLNEGENPYWNCLLNVNSVSDLQVKITVYDGDNVYDQREFKFPEKTAYTIEWITDRLHYSDPNYQVKILGEPDYRVFGLEVSSSEDNPDGKVSYIKYPMSSYELLDLYTEYKWYFETYNQQGLYSEIDSFDEILVENDTAVPQVEIKSVVMDDSSWKTNGGFINYTVTLADDTWVNDKYDSISYYRAPDDDGYWTNLKHFVLNKNENSVTVSVSVSLLVTHNNVKLYFSGKKNCFVSQAVEVPLAQISGVDYDTIPPRLVAEAAETDPYNLWIFKLVDDGSGPKEADFEILGKHFHIDETDNYTVEVDAELIEMYRVMNGSKNYCEIKYTACDMAGVSVPDNTVYQLNCGPHESVTLSRYAESFRLITDSIGMATISYYPIAQKSWFVNFITPTGTVLDVPNMKDNFVEVQYGSGNIRYVYIGKNNSKKYDYIIANGRSKNSVVICSDAPVYVYTAFTTVPYEICKDWNCETWEFHKKQWFGEVLEFDESNYTPMVYSIDFTKITANWASDITCYCVIAHFANGDVLMSEVMQK